MESYEKIRSTNLYQAFRTEGYPTRYAENKTNAFFDLEIFSLIFAFTSIGLSLILVLPGFRGKQVFYLIYISLKNKFLLIFSVYSLLFVVL